jgi:hypothetical protein
MQSEIITPDRDEKWQPRGISESQRGQDTLVRDAHGMHQVRLDLVDQAAQLPDGPVQCQRPEPLPGGGTGIDRDQLA